ncbi:hypothetical protein SIN8267_00907 [Sinobacterium norvegicum]|uniref:Uncharacterized protein n=1 Tax=Sinobacterium norvegicum TaxID=1641715 RepID=A0ABN8EHJ2_9GAMM|nr:hypothetical protein [Sinobacterium norvegicum]CAH0990807.1 hypothetical protein SIN8267_00907 [Sinobacterium norvegicum]
MYKLIFRGELLAETSREQGQVRLAKLFKLTSEKAAQLFDGKTRVLRKNMDKATAAKFQHAFKQAGLKAYFQAEQATAAEPSPKPTANSTASTDSAATAMSLAPTGTNLLSDGEKSAVTDADINTDHLSAAEAGTAIGEPQEEVLAHINTEHFDVAELGAIMADAIVEEITLVDIPEISLAEVGATLGEQKTAQDALPEVDTSSLTLSPSGSDLQDEKDELPPAPPKTSHLSLTPNDNT